MEMRYNPFWAFVMVFVAGLLLMLACLGVLALVARPVFRDVTASGFLIYVPFILTFFAAQQACKGNGPPFIHMLHDDLEAHRKRFKDWHLVYTVIFASLASAIMFALAVPSWLLADGASPFADPIMAVTTVIINAVVCFQAIKYGLAPPVPFRPDPDAVEANPAALAAWAVRRMQKKMNAPVSKR